MLFAWDAKNQMVKITYSDTSYTQSTYNGAGQRVKIQEYDNTGSHNLTSTKQYVWAGGLAEERDATNTVTKRYFGQGEQRVSGGTSTNYFYTRDHLGSIREMIDSSGVIQARYIYDPYGRRTKISGALDCDFGFTGHYRHANSSLYLAPFRAYDPNLGRWINRDPSGEHSGINLYAYCSGNPVSNTDPLGLSDQNPFDGLPSFTLGGTGCVDLMPENPLQAFDRYAAMSGGADPEDPLYDALAAALGLSGYRTTMAEETALGDMSIGSNLKLYTSGWSGNQYVDTLNIGEAAHVGGFVVAGAAVVLDTRAYSQGTISGT